MNRRRFRVAALLLQFLVAASPALSACPDENALTEHDFGSALSRPAAAPDWSRLGIVSTSVFHALHAATLAPSDAYGIGDFSPGLVWVEDSVGDDAVFAGTDAGTVYRLDLTQLPLGPDWVKDLQRAACTSDAIATAPVFHRRIQATPEFKAAYGTDLVYVGTEYSDIGSGCGGETTDNKVHALRAGDGSFEWTFNGGNSFDVDVVTGMVLDPAADRLFVTTDRRNSTSQDSVWALDVLTGNVDWSVNLGRILAPPVLHGGRLYVISTGGGEIKALDSADGSELWSVANAIPHFVEPVVIDLASGETLLAGVDYYGRVNVVRDDGGSATHLGMITLPGAVAALGTPLVDEAGRALVGASDGQVYPLDLLALTSGTPQTVEAASSIEHLLLEPPGLFGSPATYLVATSDGLLARYCTTLGTAPAMNVPTLTLPTAIALVGAVFLAGTLALHRRRLPSASDRVAPR